MRDYAIAANAFDYDQTVSAILSGDLSAMNACIECCDRHADSNRIALIWEGRDGQRATWTFGQLKDAAARFANLLDSLGIKPGDTVAGLLPRTPELLVTILGTWRLGAIYQPLFTAFGPKAVEHRIRESGARMVVTDTTNSEKLDAIEAAPRRLVVGNGPDGFWTQVNRQPNVFEPVLLSGESPFLAMFTSGTTGPAKQLHVPLKAIVAFVTYMRDAVDLRPEDNFWNIADPGWAYGLYYAVTGPLAMGHSTLFYEGSFTVDSTCRVVSEYGITNMAGSPTAFRLLLAARSEVESAIKGRLRAVSSAGEPLTPEVIRWFSSGLGCTIHDHYGQTELGMVLCNHHALRHSVSIGTAGYAMPGHRVVVLDDQQRELEPGKPGMLALDRRRSPLLWFAGYVGTRTKAFVGDYYLSGDTVELNDDGSISFVGRADDVITTSGYRVGPFDVESALVEHPAVIEAAVIGKPDPERTELVKAFVVLHGSQVGDTALAEQLQRHVRERLSAHAYPREIEFVAELPKTPSGKIQRFLLRDREKAAQQPSAAEHS
ncbi:AMP-binding protein [Stutzerimonas stutzeri]|uniref:AMP-binding protein n=1 Tax=Stutzerimonas stutzeri TaxID=316 RepID=A0A6I6LUH6_STUST|nr:AMP-binding protein [Stutzerimonas stutzeri]QGZ32397.1 AMP-binding protein [Stutzerimonas stutzeri]